MHAPDARHARRVAVAFAAAIFLVIAAAGTAKSRVAEEDGEPLARAPFVLRGRVLAMDPAPPRDEEDEEADDGDPLDETELALAAEPESELLGTSARTARRVAARRSAEDLFYSARLPGKMRLVHDHGARFME